MKAGDRLTAGDVRLDVLPPPPATDRDEIANARSLVLYVSQALCEVPCRPLEHNAAMPAEEGGLRPVFRPRGTRARRPWLHWGIASTTLHFYRGGGAP